MTPALRRISRMGPGEIAARAAERGRTAIEAARYAVGLETWPTRRPRLWAASEPAVLPGAAWPIDPARWRAIAADVRAEFPRAADDAVGRAETILDGRYDLLGYRDLSFQTARGAVDWHFDPVHGRRAPRVFWSRVPFLDPELGDHKIIWELNRHQHWLTLGRAAWLTGDRRYALRFATELESWIDANPPLRGINWASMLELALRSISWLWALHFFRPFEEGGRWSVALLAGIERQLNHVARHLSIHFSPNTHLLGEGLALYVAGRVLPGIAAARRWEAVGRHVLLSQGRAQVNADGGHAEQSTHYHRYALDFYLLALAIARNTHDAAGAALEQIVGRLASYGRALADDRGHLPTIGDDDGGQLFPICGRPPNDAADSLSLAAALLGRPDCAVGEPPEEALWMLGGNRSRLPRAAGRTPASTYLADTGYVVLRHDEDRAILDVGRHGFLNGGHAHADALSLVLSVGGHPLLIDPGTAAYTIDRAARDRFRSTAMHNTATLDGRSQSEPAGPFHWRSRADARLDRWQPGAALEYVTASHDGYAPLLHRRTVIRAGGGLWIIADHVLGTGPARMDLHWHLDPAWRPERTRETDPRVGRFQRRESQWAAIAWSAGSAEEFFEDETGLGWSSPVYGRRVPSVTIRVGAAANAPFSIVTAVASCRTAVDLSVEPCSAPDAATVGALVRFNDRELRLTLTPDNPAADLHFEERSHVWHRRIR